MIPVTMCPVCPWDPARPVSAVGVDLDIAETFRAHDGPVTDWRPIMQCQTPEPARPGPCAGYVRQCGARNDQVRALALHNSTIAGLLDVGPDPALHPDVDSMLDRFRRELPVELGHAHRVVLCSGPGDHRVVSTWRTRYRARTVARTENELVTAKARIESGVRGYAPIIDGAPCALCGHHVPDNRR
jgi:hypothetical protein